MDTLRYIYITDFIRFWGISPAFFARPRTSQNHPKPMCAQWPAQAASAQLQAEHLQVHEPLHLFGSFRGIALLPPTHLYESLRTFHNPSHPDSVEWINHPPKDQQITSISSHKHPWGILGEWHAWDLLGFWWLHMDSKFIMVYHGLSMCP